MISEDKHSITISKCEIDFYSLALCPSAFDLELVHKLSGKSIGRIAFDIQFQQIQEVSISL